jgi:exosome complex RNA-binding protein Rrp4
MNTIQEGKLPDGNVITIPYMFKPRVYQKDLMMAMDLGYKRAIAIYHRRAG